MADAPSPTALVYDASGKQTGELKLEPSIFGIEPNTTVMHQVVTAQLAARRSGSAKVKTRSEVRGGGRKPWRQKGLGRARHGSIRSPQWRGGGVVHGPSPRDYSQRTPKKMKRLALYSALSTRAAEGNIKVVDKVDWEAPKTKSAVALLAGMGIEGKVVFVLAPSDRVAARSVRNLPKAVVIGPGQLNTYDMLWADTIVFTSDTVGMVGSPGFEVADDDFVRDDAGGDS
ncbi:MAG TPA: 50S ribosomal protein L4 [Acidimicrobiia bacterium]|nr:50S ribosomal protein L4 [Acidimicrobiia bacterium]